MEAQALAATPWAMAHGIAMILGASAILFAAVILAVLLAIILFPGEKIKAMVVEKASDNMGMPPWKINYESPKLRFSRHILYNLTRPQKSLLLHHLPS